MTARLTSRAGAKAGHSDPAVKRGIAVAQRIKGTPGITGLSFPRVHIDGRVWHLNIWGGPAEMSVTYRLITVEPTPVRPSDAVSWVIPWEVCRKCSVKSSSVLCSAMVRCAARPTRFSRSTIRHISAAMSTGSFDTLLTWCEHHRRLGRATERESRIDSSPARSPS